MSTTDGHALPATRHRRVTPSPPPAASRTTDRLRMKFKFAVGLGGLFAIGAVFTIIQTYGQADQWHPFILAVTVLIIASQIWCTAYQVDGQIDLSIRSDEFADVFDTRIEEVARGERKALAQVGRVLNVIGDELGPRRPKR